MYTRIPMQTDVKIAVLGAGHGGLAMAGHLAIKGFDVKLFNRSEERLWGVKSIGGIEVEGEIDGFGKIDVASTKMKDVIEDAELIMVVVPATGHQFMAEKCASGSRALRIIKSRTLDQWSS